MTQLQEISSPPISSDRPLSTSARWFRLVYRALAWLLVAGVLVQVFLAGHALFVDPTRWNLHTNFVVVLELIGLLMLVVAFPGPFSAEQRWLTGGVFALVYLQYLTANVPGLTRAFHPVNALLIFWLAVFLARRAAPDERTNR